MLENKFRKDKLATNFDEKPYKVIERNGNTVVIENEDMEQNAEDEKLPSEETESIEQIGEQPETKPPDTKMIPQVKERPMRDRRPPSKFNDYIMGK